MIRIVIGVVMALPFLEIAGFVVIGGKLGLGLTLLWVLVAAILGLGLIRHGGLNALTRLQVALNQQREPGHSLVDGAVMVTAGLLLIIPGFVSDLMALILLLPATRNFLLRRVATHFDTRIYRAGGGTARSDPRHTVIEGEFEIVEPDDVETPGKPTTPQRQIDRPDNSA